MTTVLTFHRVVDQPEQDHDLTWDSFRRLVDSLPASVQNLEGIPAAGTIAMTFDDGTQDHLRAAEELRSRGLPATFFISAGHLGIAGRLDADQVRQLVPLGHVVGSHAYDHRPLASASSEQLLYQVRESKIRLEEICRKPVVLFAPPGGIGHEALASALESEGYRASRSMRWGIFRDHEQRWEIPCVPVTEYTWGRGWVAYAMQRHSLPVTMRLGWAVKNAMPAGLVRTVRQRLHARPPTRGRD